MVSCVPSFQNVHEMHHWLGLGLSRDEAHIQCVHPTNQHTIPYPNKGMLGVQYVMKLFAQFRNICFFDFLIQWCDLHLGCVCCTN